MKKRRERKEGNSRVSYAFLLTQLSELAKRVTELEQEVFEKNQFRLPEAPKPKPGPKRKLQKEEVLQRRDALIHWLEENWPELRIAIRKARKPEHLAPALRGAKGIGTHPFQPPFYREWEAYLPILWEFLESGRYHNNPRNIANAMAGIPELSWKRSFDICVSSPSTVEIQKRAVIDYLFRKVPYRLKAIHKAQGNVDEIRRILSRRTKDRQLQFLATQAEHVTEYLNSGKPQNRNP